MIEASPSTTQALLVGIEKYSGFNNLDGSANDVYHFCQWLRDKNVPAENISVFLSPLESNAGIVEKITSLIDSQPLEATKDRVNKALGEEAKGKQASLFIVFWTGHGLITPQGDRRLIYADATLDDLKNLNLNAQLNTMQTEAYKNLPQQLLIFDACANSQQFDFIPPDEKPQTPYVRLPSQKQMVMFAANPGEYAINKGDEQTGLFTRELMKELKSYNEIKYWLPDMEAVMRNIQQNFIKLREDGQTQQTPCFQLYQDWSGNKKERFSEIEPTNKKEIYHNPQLPRKLTIKELGQLRDLFLECDSIRDPQRRKDIILNMRKEIANNIIMEGSANIVVLSMIRTSRSYSGGLAELLEVTDKLYENASRKMQNLRNAVLQMLPEELSN